MGNRKPPIEKKPCDRASIERAASLIRQADALIIAAGAGMGVDSGLPDFRGNEGFWKAYPALGRAKIDFASMACPERFESAPQEAWGFYGHRLALYRRTQPHAGFALLKRWGERMERGYTVFTSNVDGQFQKAGFDPQRMHECHGSIHHLQCVAPCITELWSAAGFDPVVDQDTCVLTNELPRCPACHGVARPNVLMFGDWAWIEHRSSMQGKRQEAWLASVKRPVVVEVGAGTAIPSVRRFSERIVQQHGGRLVRINPREAGVPTEKDVGIAMGALAGLNAIERVLSVARR